MIRSLLARLRGTSPAPAPEPEPPELLTARDLKRMEGVHPDLVRVVRAARRHLPFMVVEGLRTRERQAQLLAEGKSRTMDSRHLTGHAVDIAPLVEGTVSWNWPDYYPMAEAMKREAARLGVPIVWGGDWRTFRDGPHFELDRERYPG